MVCTGKASYKACTALKTYNGLHLVPTLIVIARELIPFGVGLGATLQQFARPEALQSFLFALQWTIVTMFSTNVTIYHHLISQAGWNSCNLYGELW